MLLTCANYIVAGSLENANISLEQISQLTSHDGYTMQWVIAYFTKALVDRILKAWIGLHKGLNSTKITLVLEEIIVYQWKRKTKTKRARVVGKNIIKKKCI
jgi:hypothetical protein